MEKTFETEGLHDKCAMCRADLPDNWDEYEREFHNISDLKSEEFKIAAEAATLERNPPLFSKITTAQTTNVFKDRRTCLTLCAHLLPLKLEKKVR